VVEDWSEYCTLSPVREQCGEERCFALFRLVASIVSGVRCIDVFTHKSLRNEGDILIAIVGHIKPFDSRKLDVLVR